MEATEKYFSIKNINENVTKTHYLDNINMKIGGRQIKISVVQHFDSSNALLLSIHFISSVLPVTLTEDSFICNIKKTTTSIPRLTIVNIAIENKYVAVKKNARTHRLENDSND